VAGVRPGDVASVTRDALSIACGDGRTLDVTRLQFENGKPMDIGACWHNLSGMAQKGTEKP
jgi:methionyl-tRNA formyltransferase